MLTNEQAREKLKAFEKPNWRRRMLARLALHPISAFKLISVLIKQEKSNVDLMDLCTQLDKLSDSTRRKLFTALFPKLGDLVSESWNRQIKDPYHVGWQRRPFRAPNDPSLTRVVRINWLIDLINSLCTYEEDIEWVAVWAAHLGRYRSDQHLGKLLTVALDRNDAAADRIFETLCQSARGAHEIGAMGRHIPTAFLSCSRPDAWEFMEKMLLAAQREEGLRQSILEVVDMAHPQAYCRMIRLILDHNLVRFSSVVRAMDVWLGFQWDSVSTRVATRTLETLLPMLQDEQARRAALATGDPESCFLALWSTAYFDKQDAVPIATKLLKHKDIEQRFVALELLLQLGDTESLTIASSALADPDLRLPARALQELWKNDDYFVHQTDLFDRLRQLTTRLPKKAATLPPLVWPWATFKIERFSASKLLAKCLGPSTIDQFAPMLEYLDPYGRRDVARYLEKSHTSGAAARHILLKLIADPGDSVRKEAFAAFSKQKLIAADAPQVEVLLQRKPSDLRGAALMLLASQSDAAALSSADRLRASSDKLQQAAGLELLKNLQGAQRALKEVRHRLNATTNQSADEAVPATGGQAKPPKNVEAPTLDDCLGLLDPNLKRTPPAKPRDRGIPLFSDASLRCLESLDQHIHKNRETSFEAKKWDGTTLTKLLGDMWSIPFLGVGTPLKEALEELPLRQTWENWERQRPAMLRDKDGLELIRAWGLCDMVRGCYTKKDGILIQKLSGKYWNSINATFEKFNYFDHLKILIDWVAVMNPPPNLADRLLDIWETATAWVPKSEFTLKANQDESKKMGWRAPNSAISVWENMADQAGSILPGFWSPSCNVRHWQLARFYDEPAPNFSRSRPRLKVLLNGLAAGGANISDLLDQLLGPREPNSSGSVNFGDLQEITALRPSAEIMALPELHNIGQRCVDRILDIELQRGSVPTVATMPAHYISAIVGAQRLVRILQHFGDGQLKRGSVYQGQSRDSVFSHLIQHSHPATTDTPESFTKLARDAGISPERLLQVAILIPHWSSFIEVALDWPGLTEGTWWLHAHTRDDRWRFGKDTREQWVAEISRRTPLAADDLVDGAVDVDWFHRCIETMSLPRWNKLDAVAKYASGGTGHTRAAIFAKAMLGRADRRDLIKKISDKRNKDAARALGLVPLPSNGERRADLLERYAVLQELVRTSRKFGAQRRASEKRAVEIAMENLARTAGYPDPLRLQWALEIESLRDLSGGSLSVDEGDVTVTLQITDDGDLTLTAVKKGRELKAISPALKKKSPAIAELVERKTQLTRQRSRVRNSLEEAMCRGDEFTGAELQELLTHPLLAPSLRRLVMIGDGRAGYPIDGGTALIGSSGESAALRADDRIRIAHPHDLLSAGSWHEWQRDCFQRERIQPFKQVFRELYVLTDAEKGGQNESVRYAGHQVHPRQAIATLGTRGWVHHRDSGVCRTFHRQRLEVWIDFDQFFSTPADVEGLTVRSVRFTQRGHFKSIALEDIPPRIFSESMRDVDLMVAVAHRGGVDPEASASTVEMRSALIRETCAFLQFANVRLKDSRALIDGALGNYSVHLSSGVVHRMPGGMVCIVPVHAQHRGRLFLPFADDDPKSAEVLSKVLLLAEDAKIKDPTILEQLRG